jgi:hypothetical protein
MAQLEGPSGAVAEVGAGAASPMHITAKADPYGALGHYTTSHRTALVATQAANSRLFELQNAHATNLVVIHRVHVTLAQTAAHTAAIETSIDMYRCTTFTAVDTTGTVTPVASKMRTSMGAAGANLRGVTVAGAAGGMTGGTLTKDTAPMWQMQAWLLLAVPTGGPTVRSEYRWLPDVGDGEHPLVLVQNEGFILENRVLLGAAAGSSIHINVAWSELAANTY